MTERLIFKRCSSSCIALYFNRLICRRDISDCLAVLYFLYGISTDKEVWYIDFALCVCCVCLGCYGCAVKSRAGNLKLPTGKNTVRTSLDYLYTALLRSIGELVVAVDWHIDNLACVRNCELIECVVDIVILRCFCFLEVVCACRDFVKLICTLWCFCEFAVYSSLIRLIYCKLGAAQKYIGMICVNLCRSDRA